MLEYLPINLGAARAETVPRKRMRLREGVLDADGPTICTHRTARRGDQKSRATLELPNHRPSYAKATEGKKGKR